MYFWKKALKIKKIGESFYKKKHFADDTSFFENFIYKIWSIAGKKKTVNHYQCR